jgi:hypothetical protein
MTDGTTCWQVTIPDSDGGFVTFNTYGREQTRWYDDTYWIFMAKISDRVRTLTDWQPE